MSSQNSAIAGGSTVSASVGFIVAMTTQDVVAFLGLAVALMGVLTAIGGVIINYRAVDVSVITKQIRDELKQQFHEDLKETMRGFFEAQKPKIKGTDVINTSDGGGVPGYVPPSVE